MNTVAMVIGYVWLAFMAGLVALLVVAVVMRENAKRWRRELQADEPECYMPDLPASRHVRIPYRDHGPISFRTIDELIGTETVDG